jgi:hypothetical protein
MQSKSKRNKIDFVNSNQQIILKNQSIAKLGTKKSHNQIIATFEFSKMNLLYRIQT